MWNRRRTLLISGLGYLQQVPSAEFLNGILYKHKVNDTYSSEKILFKYKNYATDAKGIAKGEEEENTQPLSGITQIKRKHKILSSSPIKFEVNDKVQLSETGYVYTITKVEKLVSSNYAQVYGIIHNDSVIPKAITLN